LEENQGCAGTETQGNSRRDFGHRHARLRFNWRLSKIDRRSRAEILLQEISASTGLPRRTTFANSATGSVLSTSCFVSHARLSCNTP